MDISKLTAKAKSGDNKAFEKLYKLTEREVWFTCISFLKNETTAQDIMQETYITAFLKLDTLQKEDQFKSWINRIAVNKCKDFLKGKGEIQLDDEIFENQTIVDERMSIPEEYISDKAKREIILSIMQEVLSDVQYQTVLMHYFHEMTVDEIAEVFECSRGTVLSRLNYSRAKMKTAIEDYESKSGDKLHGVVFVPFFTTIFKEQAKSLKVPSITITLPSGESLVTAASKGVATAVKAGAVTAIKTKTMALVCGLTLLLSTTVGTSVLAGCKGDSEVPIATSSTTQTTTVSSEVSKVIEDNGLSIDEDGKITDKDGNEVKVDKDGKVEIKNEKGETVKVDVKEVKETIINEKKEESSKTEKKEESSKAESSKTESKKDNTKATQKPTSKPSESSKTEVKTTNPPKTTTPPATQKPTEKVWVDDYKTVHHEGYWEVTGTHEEPVYGWIGYNVCNDCGMKLADANQMGEHLVWEMDNGGSGSYHYEKEYVQTGTETVEDKKWVEPWDEKVKDGGHWEYR